MWSIYCVKLEALRNENHAEVCKGALTLWGAVAVLLPRARALYLLTATCSCYLFDEDAIMVPTFYGDT